MNYKLIAKRAVDIACSCFVMIALSPVIIVVYLILLSRHGRPVIFRQQRPGYGGRPFNLYKFRTMKKETTRNGRELTDDERITPVGRIIRKLSLDELPQFWNVLRGDMSLVGPRPLLMEYLDLYTPEQMRRHDMKPGITGLAQVSGRNNVPWEQKFELDVWYVDNWSLWLDLKIIIQTILKVLKMEGISSREHATVAKYRGKRDEA